MNLKKNVKDLEKKQKRISSRIKLQSASELKRQTFYALEDPEKGNHLAKFLGYALFVLIVANAVVVFFSYQPGLDPIASNIITAFYAFSTGCFCVEYIARIWIADLGDGSGTRAQARLRYIISPLGIIDFLSFAPNIVTWFFPVTPAVQATISVLRIVRLIKISRYMRGLRTIARVFIMHRHEIVAAFLVIMLLIVVSSVAMYEIEHPAQPDKFNNLFTGVYWAVTTVTGTGYGDIVPITPLGRGVGSVIMLLSVALVAIPGGIFAAGFVAEFQNANYRKIERDIKTTTKKIATKDVDKDVDAVDEHGAGPEADDHGHRDDGADDRKDADGDEAHRKTEHRDADDSRTDSRKDDDHRADDARDDGGKSDDHHVKDAPKKDEAHE